MLSYESVIFTPCKIGPIELRNRTIRSAAFENMCKDNRPSQQLIDYHTAVARGGVGMTTVAYASVNRSGVSFDGQLWMCKEIVPKLKKLTDAVHKEGAKVSIQLGHCGNMTHRRTCGCKPMGPSSGFNLYSPTFVGEMDEYEILDVVRDFGKAVNLAREAGFDCVEIHAGHGYLISQFLSPYTNHRKDIWGGNLENRMRFMKFVVREVLDAALDDIAVLVKFNMYDGVKNGIQVDEALLIAKELEKLGVHALVLSAGFVSKSPMEIIRGTMPIKTMSYYMNIWRFWWLKAGLRLVGKLLIPSVPFKEAYFLDTAKLFRKNLNMPLIYVGGLVSKDMMEEVLNSGFVAFQMARALINDTDFVNKLKNGELTRSNCKHSNYCIARMYSKDMRCYHCVDMIPDKLKKEIEDLEDK